MSGWRGTADDSSGFSLVQLLVVPLIIGGVLVAGLSLRQGPGSSPLSPDARAHAQRQAQDAVDLVNDQIRLTRENLENALSKGRPDGSLVDDDSTAERKR